MSMTFERRTGWNECTCSFFLSSCCRKRFRGRLVVTSGHTSQKSKYVFTPFIASLHSEVKACWLNSSSWELCLLLCVMESSAAPALPAKRVRRSENRFRINHQLANESLPETAGGGGLTDPTAGHPIFHSNTMLMKYVPATHLRKTQCLNEVQSLVLRRLSNIMRYYYSWLEAGRLYKYEGRTPINVNTGGRAEVMQT